MLRAHLGLGIKCGTGLERQEYSSLPRAHPVLADLSIYCAVEMLYLFLN